MGFLTIFTAPKPFVNSHIAMIQRNAIRSWKHLEGDVRVLLVGQEQGLEETALELEVEHLADVARNDHGTPLVSSIFSLARENSKSPILAYLNADIMLLPDSIDIICTVAEQASEFLVVGQRWDLRVNEEIEFDPGWDARLLQQIQEEGHLHPLGGSDYFIYPRTCFTDIPPFAIGRAGWDNWMLYHARREDWPVLNVTGSLHVIHQDHDYSHLPGGLPHYHLPETTENIRLAGGRRAIFSLLDADYVLKNGKITPVELQATKLRREIEIYPLIKWKSPALAQISFALFHPIKAFREMRGRLSWKLRRIISRE